MLIMWICICMQASYETQQDIQLMRFADYFGRAFSNVSASQFPWVKLLRESAVAKVADVSSFETFHCVDNQMIY